MGVYSDIISTTRGQARVDGASASETVARAIENPLSTIRDGQGDPTYPAGFDMSNAVQLIQPYPSRVWGGEFSLTVPLQDRQPFTTENLPFTATAEQVSQAIDQAAAEDGVTGYTPGDIAVFMRGDLNRSGIALVFSGQATQRRNHTRVRLNSLGLKSSPLRPPSPTISDSLTVPRFHTGVSAGRFALRFRGADKNVFLATSILPHDAVAARIERAIDDAAEAASVPGWANGDVAVSGGPLTTDDLTLALANGRQLSVSIKAHRLRGHIKTGKVTSVVRGQPRRTALATMKLLGLIDLPSPLPLYGTVGGVTLAGNPRLERFKRETIHLLCRQAGREEGSSDVFQDLMMLFGLRHLAQ